MYGDTGTMRRRVAQLREQGEDLRTTADQLVAQTDAIAWSGRAADSMRERIRERAARLREVAAGHDTAADSLSYHTDVVEALQDAIESTERRAHALVSDAHREPAAEDRWLAAFTPPPPGHKDWLTVELPGL